MRSKLEDVRKLAQTRVTRIRLDAQTEIDPADVAADLLDARKAFKQILARHDDGKCTCGGCCIARGALTGTWRLEGEPT